MSSNSSTSSPQLALQGVTKSYQLGTNLVQALNEVSLEVYQGGIVALMGPSGSGKSTILNLFGALDQPTSGKVIVLGREISRLGKDEQADFRNATIGFVFQNFNLIPVLTTLENVLLPSQIGQARVDDADSRAMQLLESVGLGKQIHQSVNRLSGGQMQRVAIARALINKPRIILADEPTANLDHKTSEKVLSVLRDLCNQENATVIIATHDQAVLPWCDRIVTLHDGRIASDVMQKSEIEIHS
jgi:putative ABC transport system ATP-binding protein